MSIDSRIRAQRELAIRLREISEEIEKASVHLFIHNREHLRSYHKIITREISRVANEKTENTGLVFTKFQAMKEGK